MYVLVHNNKVLVGPMKWHPSMFAGALKKLGLEIGIPRYAPRSLPLVLNHNTKIYHVQMSHVPFNPKIEYLEGPVWDFSNDIAVGSYIVRAKALNVVKSDLTNRASRARWEKENTTVKVTVQNQELVVSTSRESRANLSLLLATLTDNDTIKWKSNNGIWIDAAKSDLLAIATAINDKVQEAFNEENTIVSLINQASNAEELDEIEIIGKPNLFNRGM